MTVNYCSTTIILDGEGNPSEVDIASEDDIALELAKTISLVEVVTDTALLYKLKQQREKYLEWYIGKIAP